MSSTDQTVQVYQLRVWIREISLQIRRRLLVRCDSIIAQLHDTLQIAFGWTDEHLHQFLIRGKPYETIPTWGQTERVLEKASCFSSARTHYHRDLPLNRPLSPHARSLQTKQAVCPRSGMVSHRPCRADDV